ncbi:lipase family protein [Actinoplanes sp. NPDC049118]|uniref:lipase family protein n=1 Tax=Actinoplanes sp. NPDC049118 TaxID=3155769 RepID=UPI0033CA6B18
MRAISRDRVGRQYVVRWIAVFQAVLLSIFGVLVGAGPAAAAAVPGTVLSSAAASLPPELSPHGTAKRIEYVSTDLSGATVTVTGLVITPRRKSLRTVAWGHGTTGLADRCAPSDHQDVFWPEARAAIAELLKRGWTVAAADYPGLGTPAPHPYLIGGTTARSMIDSVKAARNLDSTLTTQYALDGHSQGGQGALFAGQLAASYDGALELRGVAAIAPVSNVDLLAPVIPGTPGQGYLVMALYGLNAVEPGFNPSTVLAQPAQERTPVLRTGCLYEILEAYAPLTARQLLNGGALPPPVVRKLAQYDNPAQSAPSAPILIVQGTADEAVPYEVTAGPLLDQLRAYGQPVSFVPLEGETHDGAVFASTTLVADWIASRFG